MTRLTARLALLAALGALQGVLAGCGAGLAVPGIPASIDGKTSPPYLPNYFSIQTREAVWQKSVVTYHIGSGVSHVLDFRRLIDTSIAAWKPAIAPWVTIEESDSPDDADILINYVPQSDGILSDFISTSGGVTLGDTVVTYDPATHAITHAVCYISENQDVGTLEAEVIHETGHALFCSAHSPNHGDVMNGTLHQFPVVTGNDWNTLRECYYQWRH